MRHIVGDNRIGKRAECFPCKRGRVGNGAEGFVGVNITDEVDHNEGQYAEVWACEACPAGRYVEEPERDGPIDEPGKGCDSCPQGKYSLDVGAEAKEQCKECDAGTYKPDNENNPHDPSIECLTCARGRYMADRGSTNECKQCPTGWFQEDEAQDACKYVFSSLLHYCCLPLHECMKRLFAYCPHAHRSTVRCAHPDAHDRDDVTITECAWQDSFWIPPANKCIRGMKHDRYVRSQRSVSAVL